MKILKIDACNECFHKNRHGNCTYDGVREIEDDNVIPDWCPLEDAPEPPKDA